MQLSSDVSRPLRNISVVPGARSISVRTLVVVLPALLVGLAAAWFPVATVLLAVPFATFALAMPFPGVTLAIAFALVPLTETVVFHLGIIDFRLPTLIWAGALAALPFRAQELWSYFREHRARAWTLFLFFGFSLVAAGFSQETRISLREAVQLTYLVGIYLFTAITVRREGGWYPPLVGLLIGLVPFVVLGFVKLIVGSFPFEQIHVDLLERSIDTFESHLGEQYSGAGAFLITRVDSFFVGAVGAANILLVSLPLLLHIVLQWRSRGSRLIAICLLPLASIMLVFTFSRAAIAILFLLLAAVGVLKKGTGRAVLFGALAFSVIALAWAPLRARMLDALDPTEPSNHIHLLLYQGALSMIAENPLLGIGPGLSPMSMPSYAPVTILASWGALSVDTHNFVLQVAAEYGLPAAVSLLCFLGTFVVPLLRSVRHAEAESLDPPTAALFSLVAAILMSLTSNGFRIELFWILLGIAGVAAAHRANPTDDTPADDADGR